MKPYSLDLRQKLLAAYERMKVSQRDLAELFGVSQSFVEKLLRQYRTTGDIAPHAQAHGFPRRLETSDDELIRHLVKAHPDATLEELCEGLVKAGGKRVSIFVMCRTLARLELPRKKIAARHRARQRIGSASARRLSGAS